MTNGGERIHHSSEPVRIYRAGPDEEGGDGGSGGGGGDGSSGSWDISKMQRLINVDTIVSTYLYIDYYSII
jgi:hypothetical protein